MGFKSCAVSAVLAVPLFFGCGGSSGTGAGVDGGTQHTDGGSGAGFVDAGLGAGLPVHVFHVLEDNCVSCHGSTPTNGASVRIISRVDLVAMSASYPDQSMGLRAI